jgi:hypothetical protein
VVFNKCIPHKNQQQQTISKGPAITEIKKRAQELKTNLVIYDNFKYLNDRSHTFVIQCLFKPAFTENASMCLIIKERSPNLN